MSFLLISDSFYPDKRSSALVIKSIYENLKNNFQECRILTFIEENIKIIDKDIHYVKTNKFRNKNYILRSFYSLIYLTKFIYKILNFHFQPKIIYIYYPSFFLLLLIPILKLKFLDKKIVIHYQDNFPENAYDLNIIKSKIIFKVIKFLRDLFIRGNIIIVNSCILKNDLEKKLNHKEIYFFHNWSFTKQLNSNIKIKKYSKFTFIYAGNLGPAQDFEIFLNAFTFSNLNANLNIFGSGRFFQDLKNKYKNNLNINFFKYLENDQLSYEFKKSHASIICLSENNKSSFIPSKFYDYCAFSLPIFALIHKQCDLNSIIPKNKLGIAFNDYNLETQKSLLNEFILNYDFFKKEGKFNIFSNNLNIFIKGLINLL